jgi:hypothetical protein
MTYTPNLEAIMADTISKTTRISTQQSISAHNPEYDQAFLTWVKCRDVLKVKNIKDKGVEYLPKLDGQDDNAYEAYKDRACPYPAVRRTINGMSGMVFMKDLVIDGLPEKLNYIKDDVTFTGIPLIGLSKSAFYETMGLGRVGLLTDHTEKNAPEQRPYITMYQAEQIINWRQERQFGKMTTILVVLSEWYNDVDPADPFVINYGEQYRVLELVMEDENGNPVSTPRYRHRLYRVELEDDQLTQEKRKLYSICTRKYGQIVMASHLISFHLLSLDLRLFAGICRTHQSKTWLMWSSATIAIQQTWRMAGIGAVFHNHTWQDSQRRMNTRLAAMKSGSAAMHKPQQVCWSSPDKA